MFSTSETSRSNSFAVSSTVGVADLHLARVAAHGDRPERELVGLRALLGAAEDRLDPRGELARRERLRDVVVGAELEADDPVGLLVAGGQHDHRHGRALAHLAADVEPVHPGQADVEHDDADRVARQLDERVLAARDPDDRVAVALEVGAHEPGDRVVVLDEEDVARVLGRGREGATAHHRHGLYYRNVASIRVAGASPGRKTCACIPLRSAFAADVRAAERDPCARGDVDADDLAVLLADRDRAAAGLRDPAAVEPDLAVLAAGVDHELAADQVGAEQVREDASA